MFVFFFFANKRFKIRDAQISPVKSRETSLSTRFGAPRTTAADERKRSITAAGFAWFFDTDQQRRRRVGSAERRLGGTSLPPAGALHRSVGDESQPAFEQREVFGAGERNGRVERRRRQRETRPGPVEDQQRRVRNGNIFHVP